MSIDEQLCVYIYMYTHMDGDSIRLRTCNDGFERMLDKRVCVGAYLAGAGISLVLVCTRKLPTAGPKANSGIPGGSF